ncbi:hypothetical protein [Mangrovitalea sediminis]|uniref:hypothetical protein n=1 Tax=Mangrovitalea sediminis TaxID=1982043 RepID=UPI000BE61204|nr:hypothetical protein [Mangrovitalea sediminis]
MADLNVIFDVSQDILDGLSSGRLERVGGVIREAGGKQVYAWLREGGSVALDSDNAKLLNQLNVLGAHAQFVSAMSVVNLAVSVAGFAIMYRKLNSIEQQINQVLLGLADVSESLEWLHVKDLSFKVARVVSVIKVLAEYEIYKSKNVKESVLIKAVSDLAELQEFFGQSLRLIIDRRMDLKRFDEFMATYRAWVSAGTIRSQVLCCLDEDDVAQKQLISFRHEHSVFGEQLKLVTSDFKRHLGENVAARESLGKIYSLCVETHEIIRGQCYLLESGLHRYSLSAPQTAELATFNGIAVLRAA